MLLKVEALIIPRWMFTPGRGQIGDGLSRNPEDRDAVRQESEEKSHLPKTLSEAFATVAKCRLNGDLIDDAEDATIPVIGTASSTCTDASSHLAPPLWDALRNLNVNRIEVIQNAPQKETATAIFLPSHIEDMNDLTMYEDWKVLGKGIQIEVVAALPPQLVTAFGGRRWLDE